MTESEFENIHDFILKNLEMKNRFDTNTSKLMSVAFGERIVKGHGHRKFFDEFLSYKEKFNTKYYEIVDNKNDSDCLFFVSFVKL